MKKLNLKFLKKEKKAKEKKPKEKRSVWKTILNIVLIGAIFLVSLILVFILYIVITSPDFEKKELFQVEPTIIYDKNGVELARVGEEDSKNITYDEFPKVLIDALIATEDSRFFQHNGLDLYRFMKTVGKTLVGSDDAGGASTISMQVIKNTYTKGTEEAKEGKVQKFVRKFRDIYMSLFKLEPNYTKEEIIEFYLNSQWFANSANINTAGTYGVERASQYYFGKSVKDVNLAEATMMVGMFQNPSRYNPYRFPERCRARQKTVLSLMVRHGYITEEEMNEVLNIPLESMLVSKDIKSSSFTVENYQAFVDYVIEEVKNDLDLDARHDSLKIYTTFDPEVQKYLQNVEDGAAYKWPDDAIQEGIAVTSVVDGSIVAMSGGRGYVAQGTNRAAGINRQPGSTAKPIVDYAMYVENVSQSSYAMLLDEKTTYSNGSSISNYDNRYRGLLTMRESLRDSRNIPALRAFKAVAKIDINLMVDFLHNIGIDYGPELYESASIGGFTKGVSPLQMSAAYAVFGRGGYYIEPYSYTKVVNNTDGKEYNNNYSKVQVLEESTAYIINNLLKTAYGGQTAAGADTGGKTGTTNLDSATKKKYKLPGGAAMDSWIMSYSPSYSIALWHGYDEIEDDAATTKHYLLSGTLGSARRRIMNYLAKNIHVKNEKFKVPKSVSAVKIEQGTIPPKLCSNNTPEKLCITEYFVSGTEPTKVSTRYLTLDNPTNGSAAIQSGIANLSWTGIAMPQELDNTYLQEYFKEYYGEYAEKYYNQRVAENANLLGVLGYDIYLGDTKVGFTTNTSFTYSGYVGGDFVIKATYSKFPQAASTGLLIQGTGAAPTVPTTPENNTTTTDPNNNGGV